MNKSNIRIPLKLIIDAIEMADDMWSQYLDIENMEVVSLPEDQFLGGLCEEDEELSELIEEEWNIRFFGLPSQSDINEYSIMEHFIWSLPGGQIQDTLENAIRGRGAFRRFKDAINRYGIEQSWYDYQNEAYREAAVRWCEGHGFGYVEDVKPDTTTRESGAKQDGGEDSAATRDNGAMRDSGTKKNSRAKKGGKAKKDSGAKKGSGEKKGEQKGKEEQNPLAWEEVSTEHIVQDEWIDFRRSAYRFPDGSVFEPYYSYSRRDYVVIVASDEEGNYLCVRQFRQGIKEVTTEFPAGGIERKDGREYGGADDLPAEDALEAAKRELLEETGYESSEWKHLLTVPSNATIADNYAYLFAAKNCRRVSGQSLDETEFLNAEKHTAQEIEALIAEGKFQQAIHVTAWLLALRG